MSTNSGQDSPDPVAEHKKLLRSCICAAVALLAPEVETLEDLHYIEDNFIRGFELAVKILLERKIARRTADGNDSDAASVETKDELTSTSSSSDDDEEMTGSKDPDNAAASIETKDELTSTSSSSDDDEEMTGGKDPDDAASIRRGATRLKRPGATTLEDSHSDSQKDAKKMSDDVPGACRAFHIAKMKEEGTAAIHRHSSGSNAKASGGGENKNKTKKKKKNKKRKISTDD